MGFALENSGLSKERQRCIKRGKRDRRKDSISFPEAKKRKRKEEISFQFQLDLPERGLVILRISFAWFPLKGNEWG